MALLRMFAVGTAIVMVAACGSASTGGSSSPGGSGSSGSSGVAVTKAPPAPPAGLSAVALLNEASPAAALDVTFAGSQDDGGVTTVDENGSGETPPNEFVSEVETATNDTHLAITLTTFPNAVDSSAAYKIDVDGFSFSVPLTGIGSSATANEEAASPCAGLPAPEQPGCYYDHKQLDFNGLGEVAVLQGGQVLTVQPTPTAMVKAQLSNEDPGQSLTQVQQTVALLQTIEITQPQAVARAVAGHMTGQTASGTYLQLPAGGLNPCAASASTLGSELKTQVTAVNVPSDTAPEQECTYTIGGEGYTAYTETDTQASMAVPPTTLESLYTTDAMNPDASSTVGPAGGGSIQTFVDGGELFDSDSLVTPTSPTSAEFGDGTIVELGSVGTSSREVLLRLEASEGASAGQTWTKDLCYDVLTQMMVAELAENDGTGYVSRALLGKYEHYLLTTCASLASK
jgi:hypothetical protein